ncbi:MAG: SDR family oxidoreductase [Egibacteraceae bacterium]
MTRILVTGGTGTVGSHVVAGLRERGIPVRVLKRDTALATDVLGDGVDLAPGDLTNPDSIHRALDGVERVFLCSPNHPRQVEFETNVIDAAAAAAVGRIVKLGANGAEIGSPLAFWDAHGRIEQHLRRSGIPFVILRPSTYMSNLLASAETVCRLGRLFAPAGDAKVTLIDPRDVAAVAVVTLTTGGHEGRTYTLTGPEALTYHDVAAQLSTAAGQPVEYVAVPDSGARGAMLRAGAPEWLAGQLEVLWRLLRQGAASATTDVVRVLLGREPRTVADFARDHSDAFRP